MLIFFFGLIMKSVMLTTWALLYNLTFKRPYLLNSELIKYLSGSLLALALCSALADLEFFFLLLMLIYISAVVILFLLAYLSAPLDTLVQPRINALKPHLFNDFKTADFFSLALYICFFNFATTFIERVSIAKLHFLLDALDAPFWINKTLLTHTNWLYVKSISNQLELQLNYEAVITPTTLGVELCTNYCLGLLSVLITLFIVLIGILDWARHAYRHQY